jgi:hypothetical protein
LCGGAYNPNYNPILLPPTIVPPPTIEPTKPEPKPKTPTKPHTPTVVPVPERVCIEGLNQVIDAASSGKAIADS